MTDIAELALKVDARQVKDANAELDRMSTASKKVDKDVDTFSSNTNSKLASITRSLGLVAAGFASLSTVRSLLDASIQLEKFNNALQVATGSAKGAAEEMAFVRAESDRLGLNLQTTAEQYSRLAAAAKGTELQGQATRDIFTSVAQAAAVMGLSAAETGGALTALEQIISKGKVSAEELRGQLGERLPGAFQIAARSIGVTTAELDKLLSTGNLTAEQLLPALAAELNRTFGPQAEQAAQGLNAQINRFNTAVFNLKIAIGELGLIELFNAGIQVVTSFVNVINTRLLPAVKSVAEFINSIPVVSTVVKAAFGGGWLATVKSANAETQALNTNLAKTESVAKSINIEAPVIKAATATRALNKELNDQRREAERTADEIKRLTREYDPLFKRNEELARLIELRAKGLPESIFNSAAAAAINDYIAAIGKTEGAIQNISKVEQTVLDGTRNFWDTNEQIWIQGVRNVQTSLANGLFNVFDDGLKGMVNGVKRAVGQMLAEFASIKILQSTGIAGLLGLGSTAAFASGGAASGGGLSALNLASLGSGALNLVQGGFGLTGAIGGGLQSLGGAIGSNSLFQFGAGVGGDLLGAGIGTAGSLGAGLGALAGPAAIAGIADIGLRQLFGDKKLGGTAGDVLGYVPIVGTLINGLFGRGAPKFQNEALVGNVSAGGFEGVLNQAFREKGGLARSDRISNFITDTDTGNLLNQFGRLSESGNIPGALRDSATDPAVKRALEVGEFLDEAFTSIGDTLKSTADKLGLSSEALNNFSAELDLVSEKGETLSEAQISEEINRISDAMIATLIPNLDELSKKGETSADTLSRLNSQFSVLESAAMLFGNTAEQAAEKVRALGIDGQTAFIDSLGGVANAATEIQEFYDTVFTDAQKLDVVKNQILSILKPLGIDFVPTLEQLYEAVESGNTELIQAAFKVDKLVKDVINLEGAADSASESISKMVDDVSKMVDDVIQTAIPKEFNDAFSSVAFGSITEAAGALDGLNSELKEFQSNTDLSAEEIKKLSGAFDEFAKMALAAVAKERREFTAGRRDAQEGRLPDPTIATTIGGKIFTETEIRAMQEAELGGAADSATALIKEQIARAGNDQQLIRDLNATLEFIKFQSGQSNISETATRLSDEELARQAAAQLKALNEAERVQRNTSFNGSVQFAFPKGTNQSADAADRARLSQLDVFKSMMADPAMSVSSAFSDLTEAARNLADELLLGDKSILNVFQKTSEAQRQYNEIIDRARSGNATSSELSSGVNNLLDAQLNSASTKFEFDRQFATVVNDLQSIGQTAEDKRLEEQKKSMAELKAEIRQLRQELNAANVAIAKSTAKTADVLDRWSVVGLPATEA